MAVLNSSHSEFGLILKQWRNRRRLSQLELSLLSSTSARHISFLERGRARPSREMVQKLAMSLEIPRSEINAALVVAGFAPAYPKAEFDSDNVAILRRAIESTLDKHMPWPALACDSDWNLIKINPAGEHIMAILGTGAATNVMTAMLAAGEPDSDFINWPEVARLMLFRLNAEQRDDPDNTALQALRAQLAAHPRINENPTPDAEELSVVVPIKLRVDDKILSFISMIAQFSAVQEITYSDIHVELFYPEDELTIEYLQSAPWAQR